MTRWTALLLGLLVIVSYVRGLKSDDQPRVLPRLGRSTHPEASGNTPLHLGVLSGGSSLTTLLSDAGVDVNIKNSAGKTALFMAAESGDTMLVRQLLRAGAESLPNNYGDSPVHIAARGCHTEVVNALLRKGVHINAETTHDPPRNPLFYAVIGKCASTTQYLCSHGATAPSFALLHFLADSGMESSLCISLMLSLLGTGMDINELSLGSTPLHLATTEGHTEIVRFLVNSGADLEIRGREGKTAIELSEEYPQIKEILEAGPITSPLFEAVMADDLDGVREALANGADIRELNSHGMTSLHVSVYHGFTRMTFLLLRRKIPLDSQMHDGDSALHLAVKKDRTELVGILLDHGAHSTFNHHGVRPIHIAARKCNTFAVGILLSRGGENVNIETRETNLDHDTPLTSAINNECLTTAELLCSHGADLTMRIRGFSMLAAAATGDDPIPMMELLLRHGVDINQQDQRGYTVLHNAVKFENADVISFLIKHGASTTITSKSGKTPAQMTDNQVLIDLVSSGSESDFKEESESVPRYLEVSDLTFDSPAELIDAVNSGFDPKLATANGWTALHIACQRGQGKIISTLLWFGVDVDSATDDTKETPLHLAASSGIEPSVRFLINGRRLASLEATDSLGETATFRAVRSGSSKMFITLVNAGVDTFLENNAGDSIFHVATRLDHVDMFSTLMKYLFDRYRIETVIDLENNDRERLLDIALSAGQLEYATFLIKSGANLNTGFNGRYSPLQRAIELRSVILVGLILGKGPPNVDYFNSEGFTALHLAAWLGGPDMGTIIRTLLAYGADPLLENSFGHMAIQLSGGDADIFNSLASRHDNPELIPQVERPVILTPPFKGTPEFQELHDADACTFCDDSLLEGPDGGPAEPVVRLHESQGHSHSFHQSCLLKWTSQGKHTCPMCRAPFGRI